MYKIASTLTQFLNDEKGPVLDKDGKHVHVPIGCLIGVLRWPSDGLIVPDDFFADDKMFVSLVRHPGVDVFKSEDGKDWTLLEDVDGVDGLSPSVHPAPSPIDIMEATRAGIHVYRNNESMANVNVTPRTGERGQPRGPMNEVPADKVRAHLERMTSKGKKRGRKGQQALDG